MSSAIYFFNNFNNYYNRIIKKYDSIDGYISDVGDATNYAVRGDNNQVLFENKGPVNFNINDGINATITYNYQYSTQGVQGQEWQPDYVVVTDVGSSIPKSRWFVIEALRTRQGQYKLSLKRDVIADNYDIVINSPAFIEKATLNNNDPMIFNKEQMDFNQIKKSEDVLTDKTKCAWIVGYISENITGNIDVEGRLDETSLGSYTSGTFIYKDVINGSWALDDYSTSAYLTINNTDYEYNGNGFVVPPFTERLVIYNQLNSISNSVIHDGMNNSYSNLLFHSQLETNTMEQCDGKDYVIDGTKKTFYEYGVYSEYEVDVNLNSSFGIEIRNKLSQYINISSIKIKRRIKVFNGSLILSKSNFKLTMKSTNRKLIDAPYRMFAMPYSVNGTNPNIKGIMFDELVSSDILYPNLTDSLKIASAIASKTTGTNPLLYDLQILPYCPFLDEIKLDITGEVYNKVWDLSSSSKDVDFTLITTGEDEVPYCALYWCNTSNFSFNIEYNINITNPKIQNQTDMWRLCSPNYDGAFDFNASQNNGMDFINVDCSYKPFSPYIHLNPNFKYLYGSDYNDARGLICGGDFSLPQTSDQWETYQRNNINYQKSFDRSIQNMEYTHKLDMKTGGVSALMSAVGQGVSTGMYTGMAGIGALAGGISLAGGIADQYINQAKYNETIDYTKDQFGFQLGNIQALPNTLNKVSSLTYNNKIFPFIEYYTCTDVEKSAFENKLYYNGMSVGRIGTIAEFLKNELSYIKCKLIRLENSSDDYHNVEAIAEELNKGVFIK